MNRSLPQLLRRSGEKVASAVYLALLAATRASFKCTYVRPRDHA